jgi:hypothetical protein
LTSYRRSGSALYFFLVHNHANPVNRMSREEGRKGRTDWRYVRRIVRGFVQDRAEKTRRQASAREVLLGIKRVCRSDQDRFEIGSV